MARLPTPGSDNNQWGNILNDYLAQAHNDDGSAKDASSSTKGVVQLTGALGGTADSPTVPGLTTHEALTSTGGAHGNNVYRWRTDGLTGWTERVLNTSGSQSFTYNVSGDRIRLQGTSPSGSSYRTFFIKDDFVAENSEISSTWWGPSAFSDPSHRPQIGHVHRMQPVGSSGSVAYVVWYDVAFGAPWVMNLNCLEGTGTTLPQGSTAAIPPTTALNRIANTYRGVIVVRAVRSSNTVTCTVNRTYPLRTWSVGDLVTIENMANSGFNASDVALTAVDPSLGTFSFAQTGTDATDADAGGTATPTSTGDTARRLIFPYNVRSRLIGPIIQFKQWAYGEPEPDWADTFHVGQATVNQNAMSVPPPTGEGQCGLFFGHAIDTTYAEVGNVTITKLP